MNIYKRNLAIQHNNQVFLSQEHKIKAKIEPLQALDEKPEISEEEILQKPKMTSKETEVEAIQGLIPKEQLKSLFVDRRKIADQLKALLEGWHDKIYEVTHEVYNKLSHAEKEMFGL